MKVMGIKAKETSGGEVSERRIIGRVMPEWGPWRLGTLANQESCFETRTEKANKDCWLLIH